MFGIAAVQIVATIVVVGLIWGGIEMLPFDNAKVKQSIASIILFGAAVFISWKFLLPGLLH